MAEAQPSSHTGVRQYFFIVKEEVSSDWKDLAFHLGFERADTDNIAGRNRDDKSRCMDLLEEWLKRNGERATIEVLKEALSEAMLQSTVDSLEKITIRAPDMQRPSSIQQTSKEENGRQPEQGLQIKDVFQEAVKGFYELRLAKFKPLIWNDNFTLNLVDIFTELELIGTRQQRQNEQRRKLHSLDDLFKTDITGLSTAPRCILIEGEAGGGKTTFLSKEALDAVSQKTELGRRHDIVLLIRLREVREGETMEEMVWDQCVPETTEGVDAQSIRAILQRSESRVLFLLDGYDELRPEAREARKAIPKLLSGKMYPKSTIVITSRPSAGVQQYTQPDCYVKIMGFSPDNMEKYVQQYFSITENPGQAEELVTMLKEEHPVVDLIHTPIFLMLVCLLWEEDPNMVSNGTMTGVYSDLLTCLGRKHCKREGVDMPTDDLPTDLASALMQLGKLALEALLKNETLLDVSEVERKCVNWQLLLNLGVLSLEVSTSKLHPRKQLNFSHKTMQEFLAGRYVAQALASEDTSVDLLQLTSITKAHEHCKLLQFTCGCDSRATKTILKELSKLRSAEFSNLEDIFDKFEILGNPEKYKLSESYRQFVLLCLDLLTERKELDVLQDFRETLPIIDLVNFPDRRRRAALKFYLENCPTSCLPDRMIVGMSRISFEELEETFTNPVPGLQLDLTVAFLPPPQLSEMIWLVSVLRNVPCLRALKLPFTKLTTMSLLPLVGALRDMPLLEELDLSWSGTLGDDGIQILKFGMLSVPHLTVLRLKGVNMTADAMSSLAALMRHLERLKILDISVNAIEDVGLESLAEILPVFLGMKELNLRMTSISAAGMRTLVPALRHLTGLIKLDISYNEEIGDPGVTCLAAILSHFKAMKVLMLRRTGITDTALSALMKDLPAELQVLDVGNNYIGESHIVSLVQTLCQPGSMNMEQDRADEEGMATAPIHNTKLQGLEIGHNLGMTTEVLRKVIQLIRSLPSLTRLDISSYLWAKLTDADALVLADSLPRLPVLEQLFMANISLDRAGFQAVVQAAEEHPSLEALTYSEDCLPDGVDASSRCLRLQRGETVFL